MPDLARIPVEPDSGSVVAINWRKPRQEVWVSDRGVWYSAMVFRGPGHRRTWSFVVGRAEAKGSPVTLLVAAGAEVYQAGYAAGVDVAADLVQGALIDARNLGPGDEISAHLAECVKCANREATDA